MTNLRTRLVPLQIVLEGLALVAIVLLALMSAWSLIAAPEQPPEPEQVPYLGEGADVCGDEILGPRPTEEQTDG